jgi:trehalose 6-phosphate phosphatase
MNVAKVIMFSRKSRKEALVVLGFEPHLLIGNHGIAGTSQEGCRNWQNVRHCLKWREQVYDMLSDVQGVEIAFLGESISLHYRKADDPEKALSLINTAIEKLKPLPRKIDGKLAVNLLPGNALTRGEALVDTMKLLGSSKAIYFGADGYDEEVFRLADADVFGIHVGENEQTAASHYIHGQSEVLGLLNSMIGMLEIHCKVCPDLVDGLERSETSPKLFKRN